ncbi:folate-binding protein 1 isoform X2 [Syzygium oleosum]|uniref:folate-binding protein 1 isoform X2 n=1 Tax=Syzygium oleosum TaxID=219896 RepID=UPI0011D2424F|nr:folate-binding protein 1 isoform X2 [Syzygium oleosum]
MRILDSSAITKLVLSISLLFLSSSDAARPDGVCVSKGGRFPPFASEGKPPGKVGRGSKGLTLCRVFRKKTCCDVSQTHPAMIATRRLSLKGEASEECAQLWELLECSICDPSVGVQPGPPLICASLCDRIFEACSNAYFSMDPMTHVLAPCGVNEVICARASECVSNGTELCLAAGFSVKLDDDRHVGSEEAPCYGGQASLDSISSSWKTANSEMPQESDDHQRLRGMPFSKTVFWAVGGMVLTGGLLFIRSRSKSHYQKIAAIQRAARRLEAQTSQKSFNSRSKKGKGT